MASLTSLATLRPALVALLFTVAILLPGPVEAQQGFNQGFIGDGGCLKLGLVNCADSTLRSGFLGIIGMGLTFVGIIALGGIIWGGITYMISVGDESKTERAKKIIFYSLLGMLIVGLSIFVVNILANFLSL